MTIPGHSQQSVAAHAQQHTNHNQPPPGGSHPSSHHPPNSGHPQAGPGSSLLGPKQPPLAAAAAGAQAASSGGGSNSNSGVPLKIRDDLMPGSQPNTNPSLSASASKPSHNGSLLNNSSSSNSSKQQQHQVKPLMTKKNTPELKDCRERKINTKKINIKDKHKLIFEEFIAFP